jgi:hypothetical protein
MLEPDPYYGPNPTVVGQKHENTGPYTVTIPVPTASGIMRQKLSFSNNAATQTLS